MNNNQSLKTLGFRKKAEIVGFCPNNKETEMRFREIGFAEGDIVEVLHRGLFGGTPINVRLHGTSIAMRPKEADMIKIRPLNDNRP